MPLRGLREPRIAAIVVALMVLVVIGASFSEWRSATDTKGTAFANDYAPMYCVGAIRDQGGNPYLAVNQARCGGRTDPQIPHSGRDEPAPIPGYDIALFALLAFLPYVVSAALWIGASLAALLAAAWAVSRMSGVSYPAAFAGFAIIGGFIDLQYGQLPPIAVAAIAVGAYLASRGRPRAAAIVCGCALLEPHIGAPALLAMAVWFPRTRVTVAAVAAVLAVISLATTGLPLNIEYFRHILALQTTAEADDSIQYSLTWLCYWFGIGDVVAARIGSIDYLLTVVLAVAIARRVALAAGCDALAVLIPPALALLGGPYIHIFQMLAAMPAAIVLAMRAPRLGGLAWAAVFLLAVPWPWILPRALTILPLLVLLFLAAAASERFSARMRVLTVAGILAAFVVLNVALAKTPTYRVIASESPAAFRERIGPLVRYTSGVTGIENRIRPPEADASYRTFAQKLPTWAGLLVLFVLALILAASPRPRPASNA